MVTTPDLEQWFSSARMSKFAAHADPPRFYSWNAHLSAAYLEHIAYVEVLLRNFVSDRLAAVSSLPHWYDDSQFQLPAPSRRAVRKAKDRLHGRGREETTGAVIAELTLDFWRFLLTRKREATIWRHLVADMPNFPAPRSRQVFKNELIEVYRLRNRVAHHEPLIQRDRSSEIRRLDRVDFALDKLARWIDPAAAEWIETNSRVALVRAARP